MLKFRTIFCFIIVAISISNCKKYNEEKYYLSLQHNNIEIRCSQIKMVIDKDQNSDILVQFGYYSEGVLRESIYIDGLNKKLGKYAMTVDDTKTISWYNIGADGDVLVGYLTLDSSAIDSSWIEISEANKRFTKIKGKFEAVMKVQSGNRWGPPGTRIFVTGEFSARK